MTAHVRSNIYTY